MLELDKLFIRVRYVRCAATRAIMAVLWLLPLSCYQETEIYVETNFTATIIDDNYTVPVSVSIENNTTGADFYRWTFEGGEPASSSLKQPGTITYAQAGTYVMTLEAWNDTQQNTQSLTLQLDSAVTLDFQTAIAINNFAPATMSITNGTTGASTYAWTFEGAEPASSTLANPPEVVYAAPGTFTVTLRVTNGRTSFVSSQEVTILPALAPAFTIVPAFEDEDYEAPLTASLVNATVSGLRYTWSSNGGTIDDATAVNPSIYLSDPGTYTVTLLANNDKEMQSVSQEITVKPNTNLYTMTDIKLGVSTAHATIGCFYAPALRAVIPSGEVTANNGAAIDLLFYSINSAFGYCRFVSPDAATAFTFPAIPSATHTYVINDVDDSGLSFTASDFDAMTDDTPLEALDIAAPDSGDAYFDGTSVPYVVLFETEDGRRGAIKVTAFEAAESPAYIVADLKIQKE